MNLVGDYIYMYIAETIQTNAYQQYPRIHLETPLNTNRLRRLIVQLTAWTRDMHTSYNSTQLHCDTLAAEQLNSWIAEYSSIA